MVDKPVKGTLVINDLRDYAVVLVDGKQVGSLDRRHRQNKLELDIPKAPAKLEILVENVGRVNYGPDILNNRKGITRNVTLDGQELRGWTITPLPLYKAEVGKLKFRRGDLAGQPTFFRGTFVMDSVGDCFVDTRGWGKGAVWVNGRSLGKYWNIGPQQTMYLPAPWLKKGKNEIVVFAMENTGRRTIQGVTEPILDELGTDPNVAPKPKRDLSKTPIMDAGDIVLRATMAKQAGWQEFELPNTATLRHLGLEVTSSYDDAFSCLSELELLGADGKPLSKDKWKVVYVNTEEQQGNEGFAEHLFDGNLKTYWHSQWQGKREDFPHRVIIDLGEITAVKAVRLRQRNPEMAGNVKDVVIYGRPQFFLFK